MWLLAAGRFFCSIRKIEGLQRPGGGSLRHKPGFLQLRLQVMVVVVDPFYSVSGVSTNWQFRIEVPEGVSCDVPEGRFL